MIKHVEYKSEKTIPNHDSKSNESANVDINEGPSGMENIEVQVIGGESHVDDKSHVRNDETSFTTDKENEKTYIMEIDNDANVSENPMEDVLNGSKRSSIQSPCLLFNMLEYKSEKTISKHDSNINNSSNVDVNEGPGNIFLA